LEIEKARIDAFKFDCQRACIAFALDDRIPGHTADSQNKVPVWLYKKLINPHNPEPGK
jgi:hypothetical protein